MKKILSVLLTAAMLLTALGMFSASAASDKVLEFNFTPGSGDKFFRYIKFSVANVTIPDGATFEYDVYLKNDVAGLGAINVIAAEEGHADMRDAIEVGVGVKDQNGIGCHPKTDISDQAFEKWYHRVFKLDDYESDTIDGFLIASEATEAGICYLDNIVIKGADGKVIFTIFDDNTDFAAYNDGKDDTTGEGTYTLNVIENPVASQQPTETDPETDPDNTPDNPPQTADFSAAVVAVAVLALGAAVVISKKRR